MEEGREGPSQWIFTFCCGSQLGGCCVRVDGTYEQAREKMVAKYGLNWAFQYSAKEWDEWKKDPERSWMMEREINF